MKFREASHYYEHRRQLAMPEDGQWLKVVEAIFGELDETRDELSSVQEELDQARADQDCDCEDDE